VFTGQGSAKWYQLVSSFWNRDALTIAIVPDASLLATIKPIIEEWTREGLLGPFFLMSPDDLVEVAGEPSKLTASIWTSTEGEITEHTLDALEQMAQFEFKTVRIIALRALSKNSQPTAQENQKMDQICDLVYKALPMAVNVASMEDQVTRLIKINMVIAPSEMPDQSNDLAFGGFWDLHLIASPEDRSTPWTADALVRSDTDRFARFALMHAASIGGLWSGLGVSPIELVNREEIAHQGKWIGRVFVNAILTDGLSRRVSAKVLDEISGATRDIYGARVAISIPGTEVIPPERVEHWVDWTVNHVFNMENGTLEFLSPIVRMPAAKANWMEWDQIKNFLKFSWDKIKVIPFWIYVWIRRKIGSGLTKAFHSDQGLVEVGISQHDPIDLRDKQLALKLVEIKSVAVAATQAMNSAPTVRSGRSTPQLWSGIRRLVFGMLDGSDLADFGLKPSPENEGRVPVFANTSQLIVDPTDSFEIPKGMQAEYRAERISWEGLEQINPIISDTRNQILNVQMLIDANISQVAQVNEEIAQLNAKMGGF
jgi:hypothetical protein